MSEGKLPNLARLRSERLLRPASPDEVPRRPRLVVVAFATGINPEPDPDLRLS